MNSCIQSSVNYPLIHALISHESSGTNVQRFSFKLMNNSLIKTLTKMNRSS